MEQKTHIWLITTDQMRADVMGFVNKEIHTPVLDKLAEEGTVFNHAYCASPVCTPSRASIFTGRYPHVHGAWNIGVSLDENEVTLCDHLKKRDYKTIGVGKMHFRPQCKAEFSREPEDVVFRDRGRAEDGTYYGFDEHHISEDNLVGEYLDWLRARDPQVADRFNLDRYRSDDAAGDVWESDMPQELHQTYWIAEKSIEAIIAHDQDQPLFLWTSFVDPHHPFNPPRAFAELYADLEIKAPIKADPEGMKLRPEHLARQSDRGYWPGGGEAHQHDEAHISRLTRNYYAMISFIDEQIGHIQEAWRQKGLYDNVLVVFTSDHGELLGDHGLLYKGPWFYEGLTRIPMIIRGPGMVQGLTTNALMEHVDIVPTLLRAIGEVPPYGVQGVSQQEVLMGHKLQVRDSALTSYDAHDRGIHAKCLRTDRYKLVVFANEKYGEMYDLEDDPQESRNLFFDPAHHAEKQQLMEKLVQRLMLDQDPLPERRARW
ncbi:arylsulfatase A-like enzyme [Paenibacillus castaneae]|uniref:sulfatase family protein n=1 Tax=Paenibacillus castaneae TaxID=474957 RepID=UPI000C9C9F65|nr:sulfatase-like hydrolase/transferase [Paenibacillus castaneae]NIK80264.1 arylsulfatase A-like enzyme [Paenibacillus castaneae]